MCNIIEISEKNQNKIIVNINGSGNIVKVANADIKNENSKIIININGNDNLIDIQKIVLVNDVFTINLNNANKNAIICKENVYINRGLNINIFPAGPGAKPDNCQIIIEKQVFFNGHNIVFMIGEENTNINIGENCLFASNISLNTSDNHGIYDLNTKKRLNQAGDINIGTHCWICNDVKFLNNTNISHDCVIATNALVTSINTPPPLYNRWSAC